MKKVKVEYTDQQIVSMYQKTGSIMVTRALSQIPYNKLKEILKRNNVETGLAVSREKQKAYYTKRRG